MATLLGKSRSSVVLFYLFYVFFFSFSLDVWCGIFNLIVLWVFKIILTRLHVHVFLP